MEIDEVTALIRTHIIERVRPNLGAISVVAAERVAEWETCQVSMNAISIYQGAARYNFPMDQLNNYADARLLTGCIHCAGKTGTRDHIPSRVLLDEPYPENLPIVPACHKCNAGFSLDEEYVACLIECARTGSIDAVERSKVQRILRDRPALSERLKQARTVSGSGVVSHNLEVERIRAVVLKLARGHAAYELSEQRCGEPSHFMAVPLRTLSSEARSHFEEVPLSSAWPEIGTRAMQRMAISMGDDAVIYSDWIEVQEGQYRYFALAEGAPVMVRIVIGEYLACEVIWGERTEAHRL